MPAVMHSTGQRKARQLAADTNAVLHAEAGEGGWLAGHSQGLPAMQPNTQIKSSTRRHAEELQTISTACGDAMNWPA